MKAKSRYRIYLLVLIVFLFSATVCAADYILPATLRSTTYAKDDVDITNNDPCVASSGITATITANGYFRKVVLRNGFKALSGSNVTIKGVGVIHPADEARTDDIDHDGLYDWWEYKFFGNLQQDWWMDPDGDGLTNLQEFNLRHTGMNPNAPLDGPMVEYTYDSIGRIQTVGIKK